jgi:CRP/FNR family transcriptional regulator, cyclic AMP receptor protein
MQRAASLDRDLGAQVERTWTDIHLHESLIVLGSEGAGRVEAWLPVPPDDRVQQVLSFEPALPAGFAIRHDAQHGNRALHFELSGQIQEPVSFAAAYLVRRRASPPVVAEADGRDPALQIAVEVVTRSRRSVDPRASSLEMAQGVVGEARRQGLAARLVAGHKVDSAIADERRCHHWAEIFVPQHGWLAADVMCDADLGALPVDHVARARGGRILLDPAQQGPRLASFGGAYVEVDGVPRGVQADLRVRVARHRSRAVRLGHRSASGDLTWLVQETAGLPVTALEPGRSFRAPGDRRLLALLLVSGRVRLVRFTADGRRLELGALRAPALVPGRRLVGDVVEAWGHAAVRPLEAGVLADVFRRHPQAAVAVLSGLGDQLVGLEDQVESLAFSDVRSRVVGCLVQLLGEESAIVGVTHEQLGDMVGAARETVTKVLCALQRAGHIHVAPRRIEVADVAGLRALVHARQ